MYHYTMDGTAGSSGQYVVTVGSDGKLMQLREPLFMTTQSPVPVGSVTAKPSEIQTNTNVIPVKNEVYQYVVNTTGGAAHYMGLMTLGADGKLLSVRTDRTTATHQPSSALTISHASLQQLQQQLQHQEHTQEQEGQQHLQQQATSQSQQQQSHAQHQQVLRPDKIVKGDREVECAKSCRACCKIDEPENPENVTVYMRQSANFFKKDVDESISSNSSQTWNANAQANFSSNTETSSNTPTKARFQCKVCLKMFTQKVNLTTHERIHLGERPYQCKVCLKSFTQQSNLVTHERIHTGERPYQCTVCLKRFTQRQNLTAHERIHLGERPFQCQVCQKSFTQRQNLTAHERIHLGERPFQCQICLKSFTQQQNLTAHERIHNSDRHFTCGVCHKPFAQESNLAKHMLVHSGEKTFTFSCQLCDRTFAQQASLSAHERAHRAQELKKKLLSCQIMKQGEESQQTEQMPHNHEQKEKCDNEERRTQC